MRSRQISWTLLLKFVGNLLNTDRTIWPCLPLEFVLHICRCGSQIDSLMTGPARSPLNNSDLSDDLLWLAQWREQHLAPSFFIFSVKY